MPGLEEVRTYLSGLWLLICGKPAGFARLDLTDRGMMRSFFAVVWCAPAILFSWFWWRNAVLAVMPPNTSLGLVFYLRLAMVEVANWVVPLVFAGLVAWFLGLGERFSALVACVNWLSLPFAYANALLMAMTMVAGLGGLVGLLWLVLMAGLVIALMRIFRMIIGPQILPVATMVMVLIVPAMLVTSELQTYLGLDLY